MAEVEPDGLEEIVGGGARVAATIGGQVLERTALRRAAEARDRAQAARASAEGDRGRVEALGATERVPDRREGAEAAVAVAVLRADDRLTGRRWAVEPDVEQAATVAGRNQALPAVEAVRGDTGTARPGRATTRGRGRGAERDRGR